MANLHGSIDPVAWQNPLHPDQLSSKPIPNWMPLYTAAPPAQQPQYEAGDMASAHNDGFRAGVASVAQQPQEPDWKHPKIQALISSDARNRIVIDLIWQILKNPDGDFSAMDMEYWDSIHDAVREAVIDAQQPQARPDFNDEWTGYLKDGETPFERFMRERKDLNALTKLYQRALEENERLKDQQPQLVGEVLPRWNTEKERVDGVHAHLHKELPVDTKLYAYLPAESKPLFPSSTPEAIEKARNFGMDLS